jgi:hypothetical protein
LPLELIILVLLFAREGHPLNPWPKECPTAFLAAVLHVIQTSHFKLGNWPRPAGLASTFAKLRLRTETESALSYRAPLSVREVEQVVVTPRAHLMHTSTH